MPFTPTLVDNFNRANQSSLGVSSSGPTWTTLGGSAVLDVVSNEAVPTASFARQAFPVSILDQQIAVKLAAKAGSYMVVYARVQTPLGTPSGYQVGWGSGLEAFRFIGGSFSGLSLTSGSASDVFATGDHMGVEITGSGATVTIRMLRSTDGGANWTELCQWQDSHADRIVAAGGAGIGAGATSAHFDDFAVSAVSVGDTDPPTDPVGLSATAVSTTGINLTWTASTDNVGVTGYRVERCDGAACVDFAQIATPATNSYSDTGLDPDTLYRYRVRAEDAATNLSGYSTVDEATTDAEPDTEPPTAPSSLVATAASSSLITLGWAASTDNVGVDEYLVERCTGAACVDFAQIATRTVTNYNNSGLTPETLYRYRVRATDAAGNFSTYSSIAEATTEAAAVGSGLGALMDEMADTLLAVVGPAAAETEVQVTGRMNPNPTPPSIDIYPGDPFRDNGTAGFGDVGGELIFTVRARVTTVDNTAGQNLLLRLMDDQDDISVAGTLMADQTLNGLASSVYVEGNTGYTRYLDGGTESGGLLGCEWRVRVLRVPA